MSEKVFYILISAGLFLTVIAVWILVRSHAMKNIHGKGGLSSHERNIESILDSANLTPEELKQVRRHIAKKFEEEVSTPDPHEMKKPVDLGTVLLEEQRKAALKRRKEPHRRD